MALMVGLGNPDAHYHNTRHNAGWQAVAVLAQELTRISGEQTVVFRPKKAWFGQVAEVSGQIFLRPTTYMNDSGKSVAAAVQSLSQRVSGKEHTPDGTLQFTQMYVFYDDLDLEIGNWKLQFGRGPKVHHGLASVIAELGTDQFWSVRLGVDGRRGDRTLSGSEYVLRPFFDQEINTVKQMYSEVAAALQQHLTS